MSHTTRPRLAPAAAGPWRQEDYGKRWSRDSPGLHLTCWECLGTFSDFGPSWQAACAQHFPDGTAITWRSAPFPPTREGLMASMAWADGKLLALAEMLREPR